MNEQRPLSNEGFSNLRIVFVGIDWERKGGPVLVEAFRQVKRRLPSAFLDIIGCSPSDLPEGAIAHGRLPHSDVAALLSRVSVFVFPALVEPFGIAPIEASTMGLPVVASDVGALPEIVVNEKTGFLVPPNDSNQLAQALIRVLSDPTLASRIGAAGRLHAVTNFSWEATADVMSTGIKARIATALAP